MRVLFATSEATPFIKSGGLADVLGSLPKEMVKKGVESIVVLPKYQDMKLADKIEFVTNFDIWVGWRKVYCGVFTYVVDGVRFYFIDNEQYYRRPGLYGYDDDYERFAYFDFAVLELISHLDIKPDIIHLHGAYVVWTLGTLRVHTHMNSSVLSPSPYSSVLVPVQFHS